MQLGHASLTDRVHLGVVGLGGGDGVVVEVADQLIGGGPGSFIGLAHDHVQAHAETHRTTMLGGAGAHVGDLHHRIRAYSALKVMWFERG